MLRTQRRQFAAIAALLFLAAPPAFAQDAETLYVRGQTLLADGNEEGVNLFKSACERGHAPACIAYASHMKPIPDLNDATNASLDELLRDKDAATDYLGSFKNNPQAVWALRRACDLRSAEGCFALGDLHDPTGLMGAPKTPENWRGAALGYGRACKEHGLEKGCTAYRRVMENRNNPETAAVLAYREERCAAGDKKSCDIVAASRASASSAASGAPADLVCASAYWLHGAVTPAEQQQAFARANYAVQQHLAANPGDDRAIVEQRVLAAGRARGERIQSGAEKAEAWRADIAACESKYRAAQPAPAAP